MPDVVGQTLEAATAALGRVRVPVVSVDTNEQDGAVGRVSAQQPPARTPVQAGAQGALTVTVPVRLVDVPDVRGMELTRATSVLDSARLTRGTVRQLEKPGRPNIVITQDPHAGGQVRPLTQVSLTVTRTVVGVPVPSLLDLTRAEAIATLRRSQLEPGVISPTPSPTAATVVEQAPAPNATVPRGSEVSFTLAIASPTPPPRVAVPSLVGLSPGNAERLLTGAPLTMERRDTLLGYGADSMVLDQQPAAGDSVPPRSVVQVLVGQGRPIPWLMIMIGIVGVSGLGVGGALTWQWLKHQKVEPAPKAEPPRDPDPEPTPPIVGFDPETGDNKTRLSSDRERPIGHELQFEARAAVVLGRVVGDEKFFRELP